MVEKKKSIKTRMSTLYDYLVQYTSTIVFGLLLYFVIIISDKIIREEQLIEKIAALTLMVITFGFFILIAKLTEIKIEIRNLKCMKK